MGLNNPLPSDLVSECQKATRILEKFVPTGKASGKGPDQLIPADILQRARGFAILTVIKAGFLFSGRAGSGLVVARLGDGSWSAPSAIGTAGIGAGGQIGAEITDFVFVLNTPSAVKAFSSGGNVTLGANISVAAGPLGRSAEAAGTGVGLAAVYAYSKTKGLFAGVSIEGSVLVERKDANAKFYGRRISAKELLSGSIPPPDQASSLYRALGRRASADVVQGQPLPHSQSHSQAQGYPNPVTQSYPNEPALNYAPHVTAAAASGALRRAEDLPPYNALSHTTSAKPASDSKYSSPSTSPYTANKTLYNTTPTAANPFTTTSASSTSSSFSSTPRSAPPPPPLPSRLGPQKAVAVFDFKGERPGDLSFNKGDLVQILKEDPSGWWIGRFGNKEGHFPANHVQIQ